MPCKEIYFDETNEWCLTFKGLPLIKEEGQEYYCMLLMALTFLCISSSSSFAATTKLYEALTIGLIFRPTIRKHTLDGQ